VHVREVGVEGIVDERGRRGELPSSEGVFPGEEGGEVGRGGGCVVDEGVRDYVRGGVDGARFRVGFLDVLQ